MSKQIIRQQLLNQRRNMHASTCVQLSAAVQRGVLASTAFVESGVLALYAPIHNEVQTGLLHQAALEAGKRVCFPRLDEDRIVFVEVESDAILTTGRFGVPEPQGGTLLSPDQLDLVLVPGVGFDRRGHRIGYGRGYYDRALAQCRRGSLVGMAYAFQVVDSLPEEEHDIRLDYLATEDEMIGFQHKQPHERYGGRT